MYNLVGYEQWAARGVLRIMRRSTLCRPQKVKHAGHVQSGAITRILHNLKNRPIASEPHGEGRGRNETVMWTTLGRMFLLSESFH
jgi:hypothetical protein